MVKFRQFLGAGTSALLLLLVSLCPSDALARCSAFPTLTTVIERVERLPNVDTWEGQAQIAFDITTFNNRLTRAYVTAQLAEFGMERHVDQVLDFKTRTGVLAVVASDRGPEALSEYLNRPSYRKSLKMVKNTLASVCTIQQDKDQTPFASRLVNVDENDHSDAAAAPVSFVPTVSIVDVFGLSSGILAISLLFFWLKTRKAKREKRVSKRVACDIPVNLFFGGRIHRVNIVDISLAGANIACKLELPVDTEIEIDFGKQRSCATVRWSNDSFAGVMLHRLLSEKFMNALIEDSKDPNKNAAPFQRAAS